MENSIILQNVSRDELKTIVKEAVKEEITAIPQKKEVHYLTRHEVCERHHLSLPTVDRRTTDGTWKGYRIGGRILYREDELPLAEIPVRKHRRQTR